MREDNEIVSHPGADRRRELADRLLVVAEKELSAFVRAVEEIFGAEQACVSTTDWIEELELIDWLDETAPPNWREVTIRASARLAAFLSEAASSRKFRISGSQVSVYSNLCSQAAQVPSSKVTCKLPRRPRRNCRIVSAFVSRMASITSLPAESRTATEIVAWCTSSRYTCHHS